MISFKEALQRDREAVFLNAREFAEEHEINGAVVVCNIQNVVTSELSGRGTSGVEGVFVNALTIYVSSINLEYKPVENELIEVDGKRHFVRSVTEEINGMLVIVCEANEQ